MQTTSGFFLTISRIQQINRTNKFKAENKSDKEKKNRNLLSYTDDFTHCQGRNGLATSVT